MSHFVNVAIPHFHTFLIVIMRVAGILTVIPIIGSRALPLMVKVGLTVGLSLALLPLANGVMIPPSGFQMAEGLASEFLIGLVLGLAVRIVFAGIDLAGEIMGTQMGLGVVQLFDPTAAQQIPVISQFLTLMSSMVFLSLNGHLLLVETVASSFSLVPPFSGTLTGPLVEDMLRLSRGMFTFALKIAAPIMATMLLINLLLAILGRAVSQINVFLLSFPILTSVGFVMLGLTLPFTADLFAAQFSQLEGTLGSLLRMLGHG